MAQHPTPGSGDPQGGVGRGLVEAARWFDESLLGLLEQAGHPEVSRTQVLLVLEVEGEAGTSASELARRLGVTRQSVHQDVRKLGAQGLVEQVPDPENRSAKRVVLTEAGRRFLEVAATATARIEEALRQRLGADRVDALRDALGADWGLPMGPSIPTMRTPAPAAAPAADPAPAVAEAAPAAAEPAPAEADEIALTEDSVSEESVPDDDARDEVPPPPAAPTEQPTPRPTPPPGTRPVGGGGFAFPGLRPSGGAGRPLGGRPGPGGRPPLANR